MLNRHKKDTFQQLIEINRNIEKWQCYAYEYLPLVSPIFYILSPNLGSHLQGDVSVMDVIDALSFLIVNNNKNIA